MNDYIIQSGDTLSGLARQYGTSVSELQRLNPSITNPDLIRAGATLRVPGQTPISSPQTIQGQQPLTLPTQDELDNRTGLQRILADIQEQTRQREESFEESQRDLRRSMEAITRFPERAQEIREEEGVADAMRGLDEIDSLIASRSRAIERQIELLETQGISGGMISRQQNQMYREGARELADLSIIQNARAGRLETAQAVAQQRIELELLPLQQQLEFDKFFYNENKQFLTESQNREFQLKIAQDEREYNEEREKQKNISNLMITVAQSGGSPELVSEISGADTYEEALEIATDQLGVPFRLQVEQQKFQNRMAEASLGLQREQLNLARQKQLFDQNLALAGMGDLNAIKELGITLPDGSSPSDLQLSWAEEYAETGKLPSGVPDNQRVAVERLAVSLPKQHHQVLSPITGVRSNNVTDAQTLGYGTKINTITRLTELYELSEQIPANAVARGFSRLSGEQREIYRKYNNLRNEILRDWRQAEFPRGGGEWTVSELQQRIPALDPNIATTFQGVPTFGGNLSFSNKPAREMLQESILALSSALNNELSAQGLVMNGFSQVRAPDGKLYTIGDIVQPAGSDQMFLLNANSTFTPINP